MPDKTTGDLQAVKVGDLPVAPDIFDDTKIPVELSGGIAAHITGLQWKYYAQFATKALAAAAQEAATQAAKAAADAQAAADSVQDVSDDAAAAAAAANAAENARAAAVQAAQYAERVAALAAEQAASGVESRLQGYVDDAEAAKNAAQTAAGNAATEAVRQAETKLQGYVSDAEKAKTDAQNAAGTAATDAVTAVGTQMAGYVTSAQAAQKAAENARDQAQAIAGGNFLPLTGGIVTGVVQHNTRQLRYYPNGHILTQKDVAGKFFSSITGAIVIVLPKTYMQFDMDVVISGPGTAWTLALTGYNNPAAGQLWYAGANGNFTGVAPYIRTATTPDGSYCFILGDVDTTWGNFIKVTVPRMTMGDITRDTLTDDLGIEVVTDLSGYTYVTELAINAGTPLDPDNLTEPVPIEKGGTDAASAEDALVNLGALPTAGGIMTGVLEFRTHTKTLRNPAFNYPLSTANNVAELNSLGFSGIGTVCITMTDANCRFDMELVMSSYDTAASVLLSGGTYYEGSMMHNPRAFGTLWGRSTQIRTATDANGRRCWLIGSVDTNWGGWLHVIIPRLTTVKVFGGNASADPSDVSISLLTDETGYTINNTVTFTPYVNDKEMNAAITNAVGDINTLLDALNGEVV